MFDNLFQDWWWVVNDNTLVSLTARLKTTEDVEEDSGDTNSDVYKSEESSSTGAPCSNDWGTLSVAKKKKTFIFIQGFKKTTIKNKIFFFLFASLGTLPLTASPGEQSDEDPIKSPAPEWLRKTSNTSTEEVPPKGLVALDLSWCGNYGAISTDEFVHFIRQCGHRLKILRLNCCDFINTFALYAIASTCKDLAGEYKLN